MTTENANSHPYKVTLTSESDGMFANSHPYKVTLEGGGGIGGRVVDELPAEGEQGYIYLILKESTPEGDIYDEYMWVLLQDGETYGWEHIGATNEVDLDVVKILTEDDYNWNTVTGTSGTPNTIALWLLDDGIYKAPSVTVYPVRNSSIGGYSGHFYIVSKAESSQNRGSVACFTGSTSMLYSAIDAEGMNYLASPFFRSIEQTTGSSTSALMSQKAITDAINASKGGVRTLTVDDYNWNYDTQTATNPNCVALWFLDPGMYIIGSGVTAKYAQSNIEYYASNEALWIVTPQGTYGKFVTQLRPNYLANQPANAIIAYRVNGNDGSLWDRFYFNQPVDNLTTNDNRFALSAKQGVVLNGRIGDLTTLTTTTKTSTVDAINELVTTLGNIQTALNIINNGSES